MEVIVTLMLFGFAEITAGFLLLGEDSIELAEKLGARVLAEDFVEPTWVRFLILGRNYFDNIALFELGAEANHLAVHNCAGTGGADVAVEAIGKI